MMAVGKKAEAVKLPEGSILNPDVHARLLADIQSIARQANVPVAMIHKSAKGYCEEPELDWVRGYQKFMSEGKAGVCFVGKFEKSIDTKMMALACVFIRNFIDARITTLAQLVQEAGAGDMPDPTVMLIPNFYVDMESGNPLAGYKVTALHDVLVDRFVRGRATVVYVSSMDVLGKQYGDAMRAFVEEHYQLIEGN